MTFRLQRWSPRRGTLAAAMLLVFFGSFPFAEASRYQPKNKQKAAKEDVALPEPSPVATPGPTPSAEQIALESQLHGTMAEMYREAVRKYQAHEYAGATKDFADCYSVWQQAQPHLSDPSKFEKMRKDCESYAQLLGSLQKTDAQRGGVQDLTDRLKLRQFHVNEAELSSVLEYLRGKIGVMSGSEAPNFVTRLSKEMLARKVTVEVQGFSIRQALEAVCGMTGVKMQFERYAVVFTPRETVETVGR